MCLSFRGDCMLLIKRILCCLVAVFLVILGILVSNDKDITWFIVGGATAVLGFSLIYVSIKQSTPGYSFFVTVIACFLAYHMFFNRNITMTTTSSESGKNITDTRVNTEKNIEKKSVEAKKIKKEKKKGIDLQSYPRISGSITVIHAHLFKINGRYIRLYGIDAPDNDQLCSDANGSSYNCGEQAASWVRNWIDNNVVDCYIFKVDPKGVDLGSCLWGNYDIGAGLVGVGWGIAKESETSIYKPYEAKAKSESSGLWQGTFYMPEDWRDIKRRRNDFTIKTRNTSSDGGFFNFKSWF